MEHAIFEASALEMAGLTINPWKFLTKKVTAYAQTMLSGAEDRSPNETDEATVG